MDTRNYRLITGYTSYRDITSEPETDFEPVLPADAETAENVDLDKTRRVSYTRKEM